MSRKPLLYPARQRCRVCRKYFAFEVILQMYCSQECAGRPDAPWRAEDLPRSCKTRNRGEWKAKAVFFTPDQAAQAARLRNIHWYLCDGPEGCGMYHLSTKSAPWAGKSEP